MSRARWPTCARRSTGAGCGSAIRHEPPARPEPDPALAEALAGWRDRGRLSDTAVHALKARRRRVAAGSAGGVAAVLLAIGLLPHVPATRPDEIAYLDTGRGESRTVRLSDGTTMRLRGRRICPSATAPASGW